MNFEPRKVYNRRRDIHSRYGGQRQGGISTPADSEFIFLFTGETGESYGYQDEWTEDGLFLYSGEGQRGDMQFVRGNKAIRDHVSEGKVLLLFQSLGKGNGYRFVGEFYCSSWELVNGFDVDETDRSVILFHLSPITDVGTDIEGEESSLIASIDSLRKAAYIAANGASEASIIEAKRISYCRSKDVRSYVLARANGMCESCGNRAPFVSKNGLPFLETHHVLRRADGGPDHPRHVAGICPNCHREIHYGENGHKRNLDLSIKLKSIETGKE